MFEYSAQSKRRFLPTDQAFWRMLKLQFNEI